MGSLTEANEGPAILAGNFNTNDETKKSGQAEAMKKLEALYQKIPADFEELTLANFGGSFKSRGSMKAERKEEYSASKSIENTKLKNLAKKDSKSVDSPVYSVDFEKALQAVRQPSPTKKTRMQSQNPSTENDLRYPSGRHNSQRALLKGSGLRNVGDPNVYSDVDEVSNMFSDSSSNLAGSCGKSCAFSTELDTSYGSSFPVENSKASRTNAHKDVPYRTGKPHTNICSICEKRVYFAKYRCLVCGRVYCKQCVGKGMGDMPEGRKCIACVGHRFSQRYIKRAGKVGFCMSLPNSVTKEELKWAELGPRKPRNRPAYSGISTPIAGLSPARSRPSLSPRPSINRVSPTRPIHPN